MTKAIGKSLEHCFANAITIARNYFLIKCYIKAVAATFSVSTKL
jgi:hypothetical protein